MTDSERFGRPVGELSDSELEHQGKHAHDTRNWVFLHGTAEQFATHTSRMLALEQEYIRRYPKRTWQGSGGAVSEKTEVEVLREALRGVSIRIASLLDREPAAGGRLADEEGDAAMLLLRRIADSSDGRMHKLEVHQAAREVGLERAALARLYTAHPPLLITDQHDRVITDEGRSALQS